MTTTQQISVVICTGLVGVELLKTEKDFKTLEALEIAGMISILDEEEQKEFQLLKQNRLVQQLEIKKRNGKILAFKGHRILVKFNDAIDAVKCADSILRTCEYETDLKLRVGIDLGAFSFTDIVTYDDGLEEVSELEAMAPVGCILVSEPIHAHIQNKKDIVSSLFDVKFSSDVREGFKAFQAAVMGKNHLSRKAGLLHHITPFKTGKKRLIVIVTLLVALVSYLLYMNLSRDQSLTDTSISQNKAIAVLPFRNESSDPQNIYFCNGLMEDVINQLSKVEGMRVPSLTSMLYYRNNPMPYAEIVEELRISHLLEGSVRFLEDRVLLNITLIDAEKNEQIWTNRYLLDLSVKDVWDVQFEVAQKIINSLQIALSSDTKYKSEDIPTENYQAYDNFLQARELIRNWSIEDNLQAINLLQEAILLDTGFHLEFSELAIALCQRTDLTAGPGVDSAQFYAQKAQELKPDAAQALSAMAYYYGLTGEPERSLRFYSDALAINPKITYNFVGYCHWQLGNYEEAVYEHFQSFNNDPNNPGVYVDLAIAALGIGLFDESMVFF